MEKFKKKSGLKRRIPGNPGLLILLFFLFVSIELVYYFIFSENRSYFTTVANKVLLNKILISDLYNSFSGTPYYYCTQFSPKKEAGLYRVILLGEASLSGWPYTTNQAVGNRVAVNLKKFVPGRKIEVITVSFAGFNSFHSKEMVEQLAQYSPDMIIIYSGHNEFYGYKTPGFDFSSLLTAGIISKIFTKQHTNDLYNYDYKVDDLELLLALYSNKKFVDSKAVEYKTVLENFAKNISSTAAFCKSKNISLIYSMLADNDLMPPVGISNAQGRLSADIIFNNARMALLRDGNEIMAEKLFIEARNQDSFRLRIPGDFNFTLKKTIRESGAELVDIKTKFRLLSQNNIPGDDLFLDYIHPNKRGLDIIVAGYSEVIISRLMGKSPAVDSLLTWQKSVFPEAGNQEILLEKVRIKKAGKQLTEANLSKKLSNASF